MSDFPSVYVGIDNGLSGAMVAISSFGGGGIIAQSTMPLKAKSTGNEVDGSQFWAWLNGNSFNMERLCVVLETPGKHSPGLLALCSMWDSYGVIRGILEVKGIRHVRVDARKWQRAMLPGCAKGDTKPVALSVARSLWPQENWLATPRSTKPHAGLIDAALISEWARRNNL